MTENILEDMTEAMEDAAGLCRSRRTDWRAWLAYIPITIGVFGGALLAAPGFLLIYLSSAAGLWIAGKDKRRP